jgi:hypothetical protein
MDHAIGQLAEYLRATIDMYSDIPKKDIEPEVRAYVKALNELELYYYGEKKTTLKNVLYFYD